MVSLALDSRSLAETYDRVGDRQFNHGKGLITALAVKAGQRVLDVGCGTGKLGAYVAEVVGPDGEVRGVDPLPLRVELANQKGVPNFVASVARAEDLSEFPDGSFDVVFFNSVLHWLPEKLGPLREARRVLRRGGRIGISTAAKEQPHDFEKILTAVFADPAFAGIASAPSATPHKVTSDELGRLLAEAGFEEIELRIRTFTDRFDTAEEVVDFNLASSFGNFLAHLTPAQRAAASDAIASRLRAFQSVDWIVLRRHLVFAVARTGRGSRP